jgi:hypothetical protein
LLLDESAISELSALLMFFLDCGMLGVVCYDLL